MDETGARQLEKKIAALESEIFSLRSEFERWKRQTQSGDLANKPAAPTKAAPAHAGIPPRPTPSTPASATPSPSRTEESIFSWEWLIGGNLIGKLGIITLIVSTAFFMVYALDQGWLSEWIRLLMLQAAFAALSWSSYQLYKKDYKYVPEILAITALAANTIAIYSAHFVYGFLGRIETMAMMFSVMCVALFFALHIRSTALTMILFGGFYALPVIHSRGLNEPKSYFLFLLAINVLYLILHLRSEKNGRTTPAYTIWVLALGNALSVFGWVGAFNQYATTPLFFCALSLTILLYAAHTAKWPAPIAHTLKPVSLLLVNALTAAMTIAVISTNKNFAIEVTAIALLCIGAINLVVTHALPQENRHLSATVLSIILCMVVGISLLLDDSPERIAQAILLTAVMFVSGRANDQLLFTTAAALNGINFLALFASLTNGNESRFLLNLQAAGLLFYVVASIWLRLHSVWPKKLRFGPVFTGVALVASFVLIITELQRIVIGKNARLLMLTLVFAAYALVLLFIGFRRQKVWFRQAGLVFMGFAVLKFYLVDIWQWNTAVRIIAGIIMGGALVVISFYYEKFRSKFRELGVILLLLGLLAPTSKIDAAEKFRANRYRYAKELALQSESIAGKKYGSVLMDAELYKAAGENDLRLVHDDKIVPYVRKLRKRDGQDKIEKEIPVAELTFSVDGENNSIYIFDNRDRARISRLRLAFQEKDFTREVELSHKTGKFQPSKTLKTLTLSRKDGKPEFHTIDFDTTAGSLQLLIQNEDDEPIHLTQFVAISEKEYLFFRLPEKFAESKKPLLLYYGADYAQKPKYDIAESASEEANVVEFILKGQTANPEFKLTPFDPPYSIWIFRVIFWFLTALIAWRLYSIYRHDARYDSA